MRTAVSGSFSFRTFVASSPSIPGMRTSMITTSGRRRSASATAAAPSAASPITRMCGARESDRRRPSRTTSWSSTIRQVISAGVSKGPGSLVSALDGQQKLFGLGELLAVQLLPPAVADAVFLRQRRHLRLERLLHVGAEIRLVAVEPLVLRQQLRPVAREALEVVLARAGLEEEQVRPHTRRAGLTRRAPVRPEHLRPRRRAARARR